MNSQLIKVIDGPEQEINVFVHGLGAVSSQEALDALCTQILLARPAGKVYLLCWSSGSFKPKPIHLVVSNGKTIYKWARHGIKIVPQALFFQLLGELALFIGKWKIIKKRAEKLGDSKLHRHLAGVKNSGAWPVNLIGHSLGARAIHWFLDSDCSSRANLNDVVFMGGAAKLNEQSWEHCCESLNGSLFNIYSKVDVPLRSPVDEKFVGRYPIVGSRKFRNRKTNYGHLQYWPDLESVLTQYWDGFNQSEYPLATVCPYGCSDDVILLDGPQIQNCPSCAGPILIERTGAYCADEALRLSSCPCGKSSPIALPLGGGADCLECGYGFERSLSGRIKYLPIDFKCESCGELLESRWGPDFVECPTCGEYA